MYSARFVLSGEMILLTLLMVMSGLLSLCSFPRDGISSSLNLAAKWSLLPLGSPASLTYVRKVSCRPCAPHRRSVQIQF
jgi:hypothetical protein